jgi:hypothetical protein
MPWRPSKKCKSYKNSLYRRSLQSGGGFHIGQKMNGWRAA